MEVIPLGTITYCYEGQYIFLFTDFWENGFMVIVQGPYNMLLEINFVRLINFWFSVVSVCWLLFSGVTFSLLLETGVRMNELVG